VLRALAYRLLRSLALWILERLPPGDPSDVTYTNAVPPQFFAAGSTRDFKQYFTGSSGVHVESLDDVCEWLFNCEFRTDLELFHQDDFWQRPLAFEQLRKGDCDDHALWGWRKLVELGTNAELFSGMRLEQDGSWAGHAWVVIKDGAHSTFFDSAVKVRSQMIMPLATVQSRLRPHFAVGRDLSTRAYNGWLHTLVEGRRRARARHRRAVA